MGYVTREDASDLRKKRLLKHRASSPVNAYIDPHLHYPLVFEIGESYIGAAMQKIEKTPFGLFVTLSGAITVEELQQALSECQQLWPVEQGPRSTIVDLRSLIAPHQDALEFLTSTFYPLRRQNLSKVAVIYDSPVIKARTKQLSFETGTTDIVRFIDASKVPDWYQQCLDWFGGGTPPTDSPTDPPHRVSPFA